MGPRGGALLRWLVAVTHFSLISRVLKQIENEIHREPEGATGGRSEHERVGVSP